MQGPARIIYPMLMASIMSFFMSGIITALNLGIGPDYVWQWMGAWKISLPLAAGGVLIAAPVARRLTETITRQFPRGA